MHTDGTRDCVQGQELLTLWMKVYASCKFPIGVRSNLYTLHKKVGFTEYNLPRTSKNMCTCILSLRDECYMYMFFCVVALVCSCTLITRKGTSSRCKLYRILTINCGLLYMRPVYKLYIHVVPPVP